MASPACTEEEFIAIWQELGSCSLVSKRLGVSERAAYSRRINIENKYKISLSSHNSQRLDEVYNRHDGRIHHTLNDGMCIVFSDAHYWPDLVSTAHKALLLFIKQFHPEIVVCNGDAFDGASISRYPRIGWDSKPTVIQEINAVKERLDEIEAVSKGKMICTLGNHDARYETFLAANSPQYEGVKGFTLKDHFPRWSPAWSLWIESANVVPTIVKHCFKGGIHATQPAGNQQQRGGALHWPLSIQGKKRRYGRERAVGNGAFDSGLPRMLSGSSGRRRCGLPE